MNVTIVPTLIVVGLIIGLLTSAVGYPGSRVTARFVMLIVTLAVPIAGGWLVLGYVLYRRRPLGTAAR